MDLCVFNTWRSIFLHIYSVTSFGSNIIFHDEFNTAYFLKNLLVSWRLLVTTVTNDSLNWRRFWFQPRCKCRLKHFPKQRCILSPHSVINPNLTPSRHCARPAEAQNITMVGNVNKTRTGKNKNKKNPKRLGSRGYRKPGVIWCCQFKTLRDADECWILRFPKIQKRKDGCGYKVFTHSHETLRHPEATLNIIITIIILHVQP